MKKYTNIYNNLKKISTESENKYIFFVSSFHRKKSVPVTKALSRIN